ncbi:hypothetical protein QQM79_15215 [Marinobacteraceae bacterium S3BR75-40.1]
MKRLFYLAPSIDSVEAISNDLHEHGVKDWRIHIVSKDEAGLYTHRLHGAGMTDKTDFVRYAERGAMAGGIFGICFLIPLAMSGVVALPGPAWVALFLFLMLIGGWIGGIGGISSRNYKVRRYDAAIDRGEHLVMVDASRKDIETTKQLMEKNHPEARLQSVDSRFNNPFVEDDGKFHMT